MNLHRRIHQSLALLAWLFLIAHVPMSRGQGTAFTYQGSLAANGSPATGLYDMTFALYTSSSGGSAVAGPDTITGVAVTNGLFTVTVDFYYVWLTANTYWLDISVSPSGTGNFTELTPRQQVTPEPVALYSEFANSANNVPVNSITVNNLRTSTSPNYGQILMFGYDGLLGWTNLPSGGGGGGGWSLTGNAGTTPGVDFLGTTDEEPLELWVAGLQTFMLDTHVNVVGGLDDTVGSSANYGAIAGGLENTINSTAPTVGGGYYNTANGAYSTASGGFNNTASGYEASVGGGGGNQATGSGAVVGGGGYDGTMSLGNTASGAASTVGGGLDNTASSYYTTVAGGYTNMASSVDATVGGGAFNNASGILSTIPGGDFNLASGNYSFAAGTFAQALHTGAFVWADDSSGTFSSTANNQFNVRAIGGVRFVTGGAGMTIDGVPVSIGGGGGGGPTNAWLTTGNLNANPANGYFLGTTDTNGLELHVNNTRGLRLDYVSDQFDFGQFIGGINVNAGCPVNSIYEGLIGATIAGGGYQQTSIPNIYSYPNTVEGNFGAIGGGYGNAAGYAGTVSGGYNNAAGSGAAVPGGYNNFAYGAGSLAAGRDAATAYDGSFIWGDGSQAANGTGANRFEVLASGGVNFYTSGVNMITGAGEGMWVSGALAGTNTTTPSQALEVNGNYVQIDGSSAANGNGAIDAYIGGNGSGSDVQIGSMNSNITGIGFWNLTSGSYMHIYCSSITIEGGSDLAEPFKMTAPQDRGDIAQGSVVVIDGQHPGQLKLSDQAYDTRVAGVVSGANGINPGIQMQQQGLLEGGKNVALTGRVYVRADASGAAIEPGDLLTTSSLPGRAMKVTDHARAAGAILGKAMTGLAGGQGMVLVLVTLQ